jgi:hypothetical protein
MRNQLPRHCLMTRSRATPRRGLTYWELQSTRAAAHLRAGRETPCDGRDECAVRCRLGRMDSPRPVIKRTQRVSAPCTISHHHTPCPARCRGNAVHVVWGWRGGGTPATALPAAKVKDTYGKSVVFLNLMKMIIQRNQNFTSYLQL